MGSSVRLTAVSFRWRICTESVYRYIETTPFTATSRGGGGFCVRFEEVRVGECGWVQKVVSRASF